MSENHAAASLEAPRRALEREIGAARWRWRRRRAAQGAVLAVATTALAMLAAALVLDALRFDEDAVGPARAAAWLVAAAALLALVVPRLFARVDDATLALYLETREPRLGALLLSAVEVSRWSAPPPGGLARAVVERAVRAVRELGPGRGHERAATRRGLTASLLLVAAMAALFAWGPAGLRHGLGLLLSPGGEPLTRSPYSIEVGPGDVEVVEGADLMVHATPRAFEPESLVLVARRPDGAEVRRVEMAEGPRPGEYEGFLLNVDEPLVYRVEGDGVRSAEHRVDVVLRPTVRRIDLLYHYPPRTGRAPQLVEDAADIRAVAGTRVEVRVTPGRPADSGRIVVDDDRNVTLALEEGTLRGTLLVEQDGHYRIELPGGGDAMVPASPEHAIQALPDGMPSVRVTRPGSDTQVTSIEEIDVAVDAADDVAVRDLELVVSVNGGPEEVTDLLADGPMPEVTGARTFYLEDLGLAPGDLLAYYARARDSADDAAREAVSDIYFMEVRPFDRAFRQANGGGGGRGGRGGGGADGLAAQQRVLVIAMFKLERDRKAVAEADRGDRVQTLATAQGRIRARVDAIVRRIASRPVVELNPGYRRMAEELPEASVAMLQVEALLALGDTAAALPPAREALLHLQRADAAFREVQVSRSQRGGGGGRDASDLANLFRLEMDRFRSQYENVQRGRWDARSDQLDETMERLRELARRQQGELERAERRAQRGLGGAESQRQLAAQVEEMIRQLERLTRERPEVEATVRELREAAEAMRRSADGQGGGTASREALDRLQAARRMLDQSRPRQLAREIEKAQRLAESLARGQEEAQQALRELRERRGDAGGAEPGEDRRQAAERIVEKKDEMLAQSADLESRLRALAEAAREPEPAAARRLREARETMRGERLAERLQRSRERVAEAPASAGEDEEEGIRRTLRAVERRIGEASGAVGGGPGGDVARSLERLRGLTRGMSGVQRRIGTAGRFEERAARGGDTSPELEAIRGEMLERSRELAGLRDDLPGGERVARDIDAVVAGLAEAAAAADTDPAILAQRHAALLARLKEVERALRGAAAAPEAPPLVAEAPPEVPRRYREMVDDYFRGLSEAW